MNSSESIENFPITYEILNSRISDFLDKYKTLEEIKGGFTRAEADIEVEKFIEELLAEKDKFSKVFKTEHGSIYFVLEDGKSLRFKYSLVGRDKIRPIKEKIFFISTEVGEELRRVPMRTNINKKIPLINYEVGATPLELNRISDQDKTIYEELEGALILTGTIDQNGNFTDMGAYGSWHFGHPVSEIIK
jgi:hypothetical protein